MSREEKLKELEQEFHSFMETRTGQEWKAEWWGIALRTERTLGILEIICMTSI